jgi:hypothetical protein
MRYSHLNVESLLEESGDDWQALKEISQWYPAE